MGSGARGAYEAGALSILVQRLREGGCEPRVYVGSGAGAITATLLAACAHLSPVDQARRVVEHWRAMSVAEVYRSPILTSPVVAARLTGRILRLPGVRLPHLLDTMPQRRNIQQGIDWTRLRDNIADHGLTLAISTTAGDDNRTAVFVERRDGVPVPCSDDERPLDYIDAQIQPEHVLASCAIPILFPAVRIRKPSGTPGWYLDGGLRLSAPLKPAIALEADALVVAATGPLRDTITTPHPGGVAPDVDDLLAELVANTFVDRMVEDVLGLGKVNSLLSEDGLMATASGRLRRKIPYVFVGPEHRETLGRLALDVLDDAPEYSTDPMVRVRQLEFRVLARAFRGDGPRRGDLVSYLYFDQEFIRAALELGQRDAESLLEGLPADEIPWRID
ncbi:hypothetical protein MELE44368_01705 [Mycolicibacterium elephantis DSM 44368]|uniref:PNPLA domain-containing protein n=2 Tax=Mycolicibacterium elephantis TaxID=81858 RepID=A0A439E0Q2_9MYCO|nr:hypothetical protein MELE44368_01705 [Mycolicibacterium elephantis DSM 44368]